MDYISFLIDVIKFYRYKRRCKYIWSEFFLSPYIILKIHGTNKKRNKKCILRKGIWYNRIVMWKYLCISFIHSTILTRKNSEWNIDWAIIKLLTTDFIESIQKNLPKIYDLDLTVFLSNYICALRHRNLCKKLFLFPFSFRKIRRKILYVYINNFAIANLVYSNILRLYEK